jgi:hypothetical protein
MNPADISIRQLLSRLTHIGGRAGAVDKKDFEGARAQATQSRSHVPVEASRAPDKDSDDYDELDHRLMDTFPASDAVARYCFDVDHKPDETVDAGQDGDVDSGRTRNGD